MANAGTRRFRGSTSSGRGGLGSPSGKPRPGWRSRTGRCGSPIAHDRTVSQIDPGANRLVTTIGIGNSPRGIAAGFGALWVASEVDRTSAGSISPAERLTGGSISARTPRRWPPAWAPCGSTSEEGGTVFRIEPRSGTVVKTIAVGNGPVGVAVGQGAVWIANRQGGDRIAHRSRRPTRSPIRCRSVRDPSAIAAGEGAVWVANTADGTVSRIDPSTARDAETIEVHSSPSAMAVVDGSLWTAAAAPAHPSRRNAAGARREPLEYNRLDPSADLTRRSTALARLRRPRRLPARRRRDVRTARRRARHRRPARRALTGGPTSSSCDRSCATPTARPSARRTSAPRSKPCSAAIPGSGSVLPRDRRRARCARRPASCDLSAGIVTDARLRTITVHLTRPDGEFLHGLAYPLAFVTPAARPFGRDAASGTGPYRIVSYHRKRGARLVRNPHFRAWSPGARPDGFADEIVVRVNPDRDAQIAAVQRARRSRRRARRRAVRRSIRRPACRARDPQRRTAPHQRHPRTGLHVPQRPHAPVRRPAGPARAQLRRRPARDHELGGGPGPRHPDLSGRASRGSPATWPSCRYTVDPDVCRKLDGAGLAAGAATRRSLRDLGDEGHRLGLRSAGRAAAVLRRAAQAPGVMEQAPAASPATTRTTSR